MFFKVIMAANYFLRIQLCKGVYTHTHAHTHTENKKANAAKCSWLVKLGEGIEIFSVLPFHFGNFFFFLRKKKEGNKQNQRPFLRGGEREWASRGRWERERERERERENLKQTPRSVWSPTWGLIPWPWDHDLRWNPQSDFQSFNPLSHPGALRDVFKWHTQTTGNVITNSLVYPLVSPQAWIKDTLINPEALKSQGLTGLEESMSHVFATRIYQEYLQLNNNMTTRWNNM